MTVLEKLHAIEYRGRIDLVPVRSIKINPWNAEGHQYGPTERSRPRMNVVDSSGWLEYFSDGPNATIFAKPIEATRTLLVPTLSLFEVFKRVTQQRSEDDALRVIAVMEQATIVDLDLATALESARLSVQHGLVM